MLIAEETSQLSKRLVGRLTASGTHPNGLFAALLVAMGRKEDRFFALLGILPIASETNQEMKNLATI
jgi:hypothetical protein